MASEYKARVSQLADENDKFFKQIEDLKVESRNHDSQIQEQKAQLKQQAKFLEEFRSACNSLKNEKEQLEVQVERLEGEKKG